MTKVRSLNNLTLCAAIVLSGCVGKIPEPSQKIANMESSASIDELSRITGGFANLSPELSGVQVVVLQRSKVVFSHATGNVRPDRPAPWSPLNTQHKLRVASISKLVTAIGLMTLVDAGKVSLDADVSRYLGFPLRNPSFPDQKITLRQILSHSSSIRDGGRYWLDVNEQFSGFFQKDGAHYENGVHFAAATGQAPGKYFEYANLNFGIVAAVIETVSEERFDLFMEKTLFRPLGLSAGYSSCAIVQKNPDLLAPLFRRNVTGDGWDPQLPWRAQVDGDMIGCYYGMPPQDRNSPVPASILAGYVPGSNPTLFSPHGGLRASAEDLAVILSMLANKGEHKGRVILKPQTVAEMIRPEIILKAEPGAENFEPAPPFDARAMGYGLSLHLQDLKKWDLSGRHRVLAGHLGQAYGLLGQFWLDPETGDGFIALISGTADNPESYPSGTTSLYRPEELLLRWWLKYYGPEAKITDINSKTRQDANTYDRAQWASENTGRHSTDATSRCQRPLNSSQSCRGRLRRDATLLSKDSFFPLPSDQRSNKNWNQVR